MNKLGVKKIRDFQAIISKKNNRRFLVSAHVLNIISHIEKLSQLGPVMNHE